MRSCAASPTPICSAQNGVTCSISSNNVLNAATPFGDCSLIRMANLHANILQIAAPDELRALFRMLTDRSARLLNLKDYGLAVGNPADLVVIDAETPEQAIAEIRPPLAVWKARPPHRHPAPAGIARACVKHGRATRLRAVVAGSGAAYHLSRNHRGARHGALAELDAAPDTIEAELIYLAKPEKLVTYVAKPGGVDQREGGENVTHRVRLHNGRPLADRFEFEREGFRFVPHRTQVADFTTTPRSGGSTTRNARS